MAENQGLSPAELAALDLMIAELQGEAAGGRVSAEASEAFFTPAIVRTAIVLTRVATRYTPYILDAIGATRLSSDQVESARSVGDLGNVSVDDLIELRRRMG